MRAEEAPDFAKEIRPILEENCFECHGAKKQKGGLRLDRRADFLTGGDSAKAPFDAGKSADSEMVKRILSQDDDEKMPPKGARVPLEQVAKIKAWIDAGAVMADDESSAATKHWAYLKPEAKPLPEIRDPQARVRNGIDRWILARLEKESLKPSVEADPAVLLRRVSLDLTGLPPTLAEVETFLADKSPDAYGKAVARLLASPAYGERWARPWLDLARYADTRGYEKDNRRTMWPYRDWVVGALNRDLPFDQFTIAQIVGDLLPNATQHQKVATGFHRDTMTNTEGGTDDEEFRYEALVDRVNTTFGVWMGSTMACAQCHNHKYDPLLTKEYYQAMAFLNNTADSDKDNEYPTMQVFATGQRRQLDALRAKQAAAEKALAEAVNSDAFAKVRAEWERRAVPLEWTTLDPIEAGSDGAVKLLKAGENALLATGANPAKATYNVAAKTVLKGITGFRLEALADDALPGKGPVAHAIDGNAETGWAWAPQFGQPHTATFAAAQSFGDGGETTLVFTLEHTNSQWAQHVLGKSRFAVTNAPPEPRPFRRRFQRC